MPRGFATPLPCACLLGIRPPWRVHPSSLPLRLGRDLYSTRCLSIRLDRPSPWHRCFQLAFLNGFVYRKFYPLQLIKFIFKIIILEINILKTFIISLILTLSAYFFYSHATNLILTKINHQSQKFI